MKKVRRYQRLLVLVVISVLFSSVARGHTYELRPLIPVPGKRSCALDVNDSGTVVGWSFNSDNRFYPVYWDADGTVHALDWYEGCATAINSNGQIAGYSYRTALPSAVVYTRPYFSYTQPVGSDAVPEDINDIGDIVGFNGTQLQGSHAFARVNNLNLTIPEFNANNSKAFDINNNGAFVGCLWTSAVDQRGFIYSSGQLTIINELRGLYAINDHGQAVGIGQDSRLYMYQNGQLADLGALPQYDTNPARDTGMHINESGQISIYLPAPVSGAIPLVMLDGTLVDPNTLIDHTSGWTITRAKGINEQGYIAGEASDATGQLGAIVLTPVPEPSELIGILLFGWACLRRERAEA